MIRIVVSNPKRVAGEHKFDDLNQAFDWLAKNLGRPQELKGNIILKLAETGHYSVHSTSRSLTCEYDHALGPMVKRLARETGFLRATKGSDAGLDFRQVHQFIEALGN
jgi:hypothetical protein